MEKLNLSISGMTCGHCVASVKSALSELDGVTVEDVRVGSAEVSYDPANRTAESIADAVNDVGYQAVPAGRAA